MVGDALACRSKVLGSRDQAHQGCLYMNRSCCARLVWRRRDYSPVYTNYGRIRATAGSEKRMRLQRRHVFRHQGPRMGAPRPKSGGLLAYLDPPPFPAPVVVLMAR
jgi:hypothetical protein